MGISGPVLAFLTASLYVAFKGAFNWGEDAYAVIMLVLSAMLGAFPAVKSHYRPILKLAMWPVATVMIFATAWGASSGMSAGEEALSSKSEPVPIVAAAEPAGRMQVIPVGVPLAPITTERHRTNEFHRMVFTNQPLIYVSGSTNQSSFHGGFFKRLK